MGRTATIESSPEIRAKSAHSREQFRERFGHSFDPKGYYGHPFFGFNCQKCGVHISLVRPTRWLESEHKGNFPGLALPEFSGLKSGVL